MTNRFERFIRPWHYRKRLFGLQIDGIVVQNAPHRRVKGIYIRWRHCKQNAHHEGKSAIFAIEKLANVIVSASAAGIGGFIV